jgi:hypothetical protein
MLFAACSSHVSQKSPERRTPLIADAPCSPLLIYKWSDACPHGLPADDLRSTILDMALHHAHAEFVLLDLHTISAQTATPTLLPLSLRHPKPYSDTVVMHS